MSQKIVSPRGSPKSRVWCITDTPYEKDGEKGYVFSCPYGFVFDKCWRDAGITESPFICSISSLDISSGNASGNSIVDFKGIISTLEQNRPPIICTLGKTATALFCPETATLESRKKGVQDEFETSLEKYAGSLLTCGDLSFEHYVIPLLKPDSVVNHWDYRFVYVNIDLGHIKEEVDFFDRNNKLQPLTKRELIVEPMYNDLMTYLNDCLKVPLVSVDIETIRPLKSTKISELKGHPGYPYTVSIADSPYRGISFSLWDYTEDQTVKIFDELDLLLSSVPQVGQNYFSFDSHFLEALGFNLCLGRCQDTMLRHHLLWPELQHKLQFLTKQYTREPYYKDEGKGWSPKHKKKLMYYNTKDSTVTYEIYLGQELEFDDRPYLR